MIGGLRISGCIVIMLFMANIALAQIGLKGGVGVSDIVFEKEGQTPYLGYEIDYMEHKNPLLSFQAGVFADFNLGRKFQFQPELLFVRQGLDYDIQFLYDNVTYQIRINYLQLPLLFYYKGAPAKKSRPGLFAGSYASLKLKAIRDIQIEGENKSSSTPVVTDYDLGVMAGISLDIDLGSGQLITELRTSYGLVDILEIVDGYVRSLDGPDHEKARNVSVSILVAYRFAGIFIKEKVAP